MADRYIPSKGFYLDPGPRIPEPGPDGRAYHQVLKVVPPSTRARLRDTSVPRRCGDDGRNQTSNSSSEVGLAMTALSLVGTMAGTYLAAAGLELATAATAAAAAGVAVTAPYLAGTGAERVTSQGSITGSPGYRPYFWRSFQDARATAAAIRRAVTDRVGVNATQHVDAAASVFTIGDDTHSTVDGDIAERFISLVDNGELTAPPAQPASPAEHEGAINVNPWAAPEEQIAAQSIETEADHGAMEPDPKAVT